MRVIIFLIFVFCFCSCDYFSFKRKKNLQALDTIVDIHSVDIFPSFKVCDSIIEKAEKEGCFRNTVYQEITNSLAKQDIKVKRDIDEIVQVVIAVHTNKAISLKSMEASQKVYEEIPDIKKILEKSIRELPEVFPAIKRSIPVTSEYTLPIRIQLQH